MGACAAACGEEAGVSTCAYSGVFQAPRDGTEWNDERLEGLLSESKSTWSGSGTDRAPYCLRKKPSNLSQSQTALLSLNSLLQFP